MEEVGAVATWHHYGPAYAALASFYHLIPQDTINTPRIAENRALLDVFEPGSVFKFDGMRCIEHGLVI